jgi:hypothetical protein
MEALRKKERGGQNKDETQFTTKEMVHVWVSPRYWMLMYFLAGFKKKSHPVLDQTQGSGAVFSWLYGKLYYVLELSVKYPSLHPVFHPLYPFSMVSTKERHFSKSQYEKMLILNI